MELNYNSNGSKLDYNNNEQIIDTFNLVEKYEFKNNKIGSKIESDLFQYLEDNKLGLEDILFKSTESNEIIYAKQFNGLGLWGKIDAVISFNEDISKIKGFGVISQEETPGLGARIEEDWFKNQFVNQSIPTKPYNEAKNYMLFLKFFWW